jgi:2-polyprenyl-6-methoxyphenol hydroxylase-like FAD-dependent oxidoreductase
MGLCCVQGGGGCRAKVLIGADGNLSQVRRQLLQDGLPTFAGVAVWRAMRCGEASLHWSVT